MFSPGVQGPLDTQAEHPAWSSTSLDLNSTPDVQPGYPDVQPGYPDVQPGYPEAPGYPG